MCALPLMTQLMPDQYKPCTKYFRDEGVPANGIDDGAYELRTTLVETTGVSSDVDISMISLGHILG